MPRDTRGIVLACSFIACAAFGVATVLSVGDPIGWLYMLVAVAGLLFLPTRGLPVFLWLLVAVGGAAVALAGNPSGWIQCALGSGLAMVAFFPPLESTAGEISQPVLERSVTEAPSATSSTTRVRLRTFGQLQIISDGADIALRLEPRIRFLLGYLLCRHVLGYAGTERTQLGDAVAHGIDPQQQIVRVRKQLHELTALDPALKNLVVTDPRRIRLRLDAVDWDVTPVLETARGLPKDRALVSADTAGELGLLLVATRGEFLSGFEELTKEVTQDKSDGADLVQAARVTLGGARADLARALGDYYVAAGHAAVAIPYLEDVLRDCPEPKDPARLLVAALLQTGQIARAGKVRREYGLIEES